MVTLNLCFQKNISGLINYFGIKWGVCLPSACTAIDVALTYDVILSVADPLKDLNVSLGVVPVPKTSATSESVKPQFESGAIAFM